ncbi:MAG: 16S rRNA (cytidine(1402)-2'-O)-methyltransferase [Nanoarchaeota archaeon]
MLYIVSTPIGNLEDITFRAIRILREVDFIVSEDTRTTTKLLKYYQIPKKPLLSFNDYNSKKKIPLIIDLIKKEKTCALVSEKGTPCICDPGYQLINECLNNNIQISPIPGATAVISALVTSGFSSDQFTFIGFLPKSKNKIEKIIKNDELNKRTLIIYESMYRIIKTLKILNEIIPDRKICIAREITKKFEEFNIDKVTKITKDYKNRKKQETKGEYVIIIEKNTTKK